MDRPQTNSMQSLIGLAKNMKQRYIGSTSSVSAVLSHFYFVMSNFKEVNTSCLSRAFDKEVNTEKE